MAAKIKTTSKTADASKTADTGIPIDTSIPTDATTPAIDAAPTYLNDPMYLATIPEREIRDLAYQIDRLASRYDYKKGTEARMVAELLKMAAHAMDRVRFSDLHEVEKANPAKGE